MKKPNAKILIVLCFIFSIGIYCQDRGVGNLTVSKLPAKEKRWALIIGVDAYQKDISPLYGTVNDAKALRDVLIKSAGFTDERIILMTSDSDDADLIPTRGNIIDQLDKLQRVVPEDGLILCSFSGHGVSIGSDAFIVPSDGRIYPSVNLMRQRAIDVLQIRQAIQDTKVKQVIMFLDACRNDPVKGKGDVDNNLTTAYASGFSFETKNQNIEAYATLYATSFGDRAYEFLDKKTGKYRGYFSHAIEEGLIGSAANGKGEVTLAGLITYIEDTVKERVRINENQKQIPYPTTEGFKNSDLVIAVVNSPSVNPNIRKHNENELIESYFLQAKKELDNKNYGKALELYNTILSIKPDSFEAYYLLSFVKIADNEYKQALQNLDKSIGINPEYTLAYLGLGLIHAYLGEDGTGHKDLEEDEYNKLAFNLREFPDSLLRGFLISPVRA